MKRFAFPAAVVLILGLCVFIGFRLGTSQGVDSGTTGLAQGPARFREVSPDGPYGDASTLQSPDGLGRASSNPRKPKVERELGKFGRTNLFAKRLLGDQGEITGGALKEAGIPLARMADVQAVVDILWRDMSADLADRITLDQTETPPDRSVRVYRIPGDPERGNERLKQFHAALRSEFGNSEGDILFDALNHGNYFGDFGRADLRVVFSNTITYPGIAAPSVKVFVNDTPAARQAMPVSSFTGEDNLWERFGTTFSKLEQ